MRIGVIGMKWGLMHVGAFHAAEAEVVALCGQHEDSTREVAAREGITLDKGRGRKHQGRKRDVIKRTPPNAGEHLRPMAHQR